MKVIKRLFYQHFEGIVNIAQERAAIMRELLLLKGVDSN